MSRLVISIDSTVVYDLVDKFCAPHSSDDDTRRHYTRVTVDGYWITDTTDTEVFIAIYPKDSAINM